MAEVLETIDGIARRLGRDVYYLALVDEAGGFRDRGFHRTIRYPGGRLLLHSLGMCRLRS